MKRDELSELHYITPIDNVPSILQRGILSHRRVRKIQHRSVAQQVIQDRRAKVVVPSGHRLHEYANLYICARNPMLYKRRAHHAELCVVRVSPNVLDLANVVITDGNASSGYVRFASAPDGLRIVERNLTFADYWTAPDPIQYYRRKFAKCAEVLVPNRVPPEYMVGAYVSCRESVGRMRQMNVEINVSINKHLFFQ